MKSEKFIKTLNNTELGKGTTHESYVLVNGGYNVDNIFDSFTNGITSFIDKFDKSNIDNIRMQTGRETRIVGLGYYYKKYGLNAGDLLVFERIENFDGSIFYYLNNIKKNNNIVLQRVGSKGYEILTQNISIKYPLIIDMCLLDDLYRDVQISFRQSVPKRADSPIDTAFYDLIVDGENYNIGDKEMIELILEDDLKILKKLKTWNKYTVQW